MQEGALQRARRIGTQLDGGRGSGAGDGFPLKDRDLRQGNERRHALGVTLELIEEDRHELRVELLAAQPDKLVAHALVRLRGLVRPAVDHRLVRVGDRTMRAPSGICSPRRPSG